MSPFVTPQTVCGFVCSLCFSFLQMTGHSAEPLTVSEASSLNLCLTPPYCSDAKRNESGELINMDFFVAQDDAETSHLLHLVEIAHTNRILPQISSKDYRGALGDIKYTLNRFPNHPRGLVLMGLYGRLTKSHALAIPYYEKAIRLYPQYALTRAQYGAYMVSLGNLDEGIKKLTAVVEIDPDLAFAHVWLAAAYYKRGNVEFGRAAEAKARELGFDGKISLDIPQDTPSRK